MTLTNLAKRLLIDLFKASEGLFVFTLYHRYSISPKELFLAIKELQENNLITNENDRLSLTQKAKEFIITNKIFVQRRVNKFDTIPENFLGRSIAINQFYLPTSIDFKIEY